MTETGANAERGRGGRAKFMVATSAVVAVVLAVSGIVVLRGEDKRVWPRPYDPAQALDISGVPGVSSEQEERARKLVEAAIEAAPLWADFEKTKAAGFSSNGEELNGFEHLVNPEMVLDGHFLDPTRPESLVYKVDGDERILQAYMFMADPGIPLDAPELTGFAGRLIEWHNHSSLCWIRDPQNPDAKTPGLKGADGTCRSPLRSSAGALNQKLPTPGLLPASDYAMTHVWVVPHPCGPFAAVAANGFAEGFALTEAAERVDICPAMTRP